MSWASFVNEPSKGKFIVSHTDLDGIARAASALLAPDWGSARVLIRYARKGPATLPPAIPQFLEFAEQLVPAGSTVLFIDIPVDVRNPQAYLGALKRFASSREVVWTDHHETDAPFLPQLNRIPNVTTLWFGPSAYEYTVALQSWLGGDPNSPEVQLLAKLSGVGDRDPVVAKRFKRELPDLLAIADGLDVIIREMSKGGEAEYGDLARRLAFSLSDVVSQARERAEEIPVPARYTLFARSVLVTEELPAAWGPKSLERVAFKAGKVYAMGVSPDPRTGTYVVRAITLWTALAEQNVPEVGMLESFRSLVSGIGQKPYGPPAAPVVPGFTRFEEALRFAERLAEAIDLEVYTSKAVSLISESSVASALASDFKVILEKLAEILDEQRKLYREYLRLKEEQVRLLRGATEGQRRCYD